MSEIKQSEMSDGFKEITKLDVDKYLVLKWEDITKANLDEMAIDLCKYVSASQKRGGKQENSYVILNLDDEIDMKYLFAQLKKKYYINDIEHLNILDVKNISIPLVNAILKVKGDSHE